MTKDETTKLTRYLRKTLVNDAIELRPMMKKDDLLEMYIGGEAVGLVYRDVDEDDGEVSYSVRMVILDIDLADV